MQGAHGPLAADAEMLAKAHAYGASYAERHATQVHRLPQGAVWGIQVEIPALHKPCVQHHTSTITGKGHPLRCTVGLRP